MTQKQAEKLVEKADIVLITCLTASLKEKSGVKVSTFSVNKYGDDLYKDSKLHRDEKGDVVIKLVLNGNII